MDNTRQGNGKTIALLDVIDAPRNPGFVHNIALLPGERMCILVVVFGPLSFCVEDDPWGFWRKMVVAAAVAFVAIVVITCVASWKILNVIFGARRAFMLKKGS
eukprot:gnl/MRDRNA2_/MRDRNA2_292719_c0_seq1.p2 gnl/MRDRNA2_/MRDRNA2_292719_c0~~gnl/MRDRNA2_/MRDRNA2_292719_c0_seq1.p2  ORF type:complete len:113 (+),score=20.73 gnl/MRDRNA2_/MRDRNA2_292719_c0_seq1:32-340(+)